MVATVFVVIMRAGSGFLDGMLEVVPGARVGHVGLYRDPKTLVAVEYYFKMPQDMHERDAIVLDPMLATAQVTASSSRSLLWTCMVFSISKLADHLAVQVVLALHPYDGHRARHLAHHIAHELVLQDAQLAGHHVTQVTF